MKIIEIRTCKECPYSEYSNIYNEYVCLETGSTLDRLLKIHSDCPLKDKCEKRPNMYEVVCK